MLQAQLVAERTAFDVRMSAISRAAATSTRAVLAPVAGPEARGHSRHANVSSSVTSVQLVSFTVPNRGTPRPPRSPESAADRQPMVADALLKHPKTALAIPTTS